MPAACQHMKAIRFLLPHSRRNHTEKFFIIKSVFHTDCSSEARIRIYSSYSPAGGFAGKQLLKSFKLVRQRDMYRCHRSDISGSSDLSEKRIYKFSNLLLPQFQSDRTGPAKLRLLRNLPYNIGKAFYAKKRSVDILNCTAPALSPVFPHLLSDRPRKSLLNHSHWVSFDLLLSCFRIRVSVKLFGTILRMFPRNLSHSVAVVKQALLRGIPHRTRPSSGG